MQQTLSMDPEFVEEDDPEGTQLPDSISRPASIAYESEFSLFRKAKRILRRPSRQILAVVVVAIGVTGFLTGAVVFHLFGPRTDCWTRPAAPPNTAVFTIVMANEGQNIGFNGSEAHGVSPSNPWPIMNVTLNQSVIIHLINNDTQAHGFQIIHYFAQGLGQAGLGPGMCYDISFRANVLGTFTVRCDIFCTIHYPYMQYGEFNVNR